MKSLASFTATFGVVAGGGRDAGRETTPGEDEAPSAQLHRWRARMGAGLVSVFGAAEGSATMTQPSCGSEK